MPSLPSRRESQLENVSWSYLLECGTMIRVISWALRSARAVSRHSVILPSGRRIFPFPGGCDEEISVFLYRGHVEKEIIDQLGGREGGLLEHGELIKVRVVPYDELGRKTPDAKLLMAVALYEMAKRNGLIPPLKA
ncbi:hypothetical protein MLD38_018430 [Melastoma candidum]|uniref:Uncharacterized protein n=1 Tax=Melastoma candidum TaxID=119954 RepID=A0ACB9QUW2_9MYRT|nr:hypothetical protein MLD38_018430 [Melastoma candidum]